MELETTNLLKVATVKKKHIDQLDRVEVDSMMSANPDRILEGMTKLFWYCESSNRVGWLVVKTESDGVLHYRRLNLGHWDWPFTKEFIIKGVPQAFVD